MVTNGWVEVKPRECYNGAMDQLTFTGHLAELRRRIIVSLSAVSAAAIFCFFYSTEILDILVRPIRGRVGEFYFFSPADAFIIKVKTALLAGLVVASPLVACELWLFISPGLKRQEKAALLPVIFAASFLFLGGALFCFYCVLPTTLEFLMGQQTAYLKPMVSMNEYLGFLSGMMIAFGVSFNLPVFVAGAAAAGVVTAQSLRRHWRHAVVVIFIAAAVLTPSPDIASQLALALPMMALYELSVGAAWLIGKKKGK